MRAACAGWEKYTRALTPQRVTWLQDDVLQNRFYWLAVPPEQARARQLIIVNQGSESVRNSSGAMPSS